MGDIWTINQQTWQKIGTYLHAAYIYNHNKAQREEANKIKENTKSNKGCVTHHGLAIYIEKYLKGNRRIMKTQIFCHAKI